MFLVMKRGLGAGERIQISKGILKGGEKNGKD